MSLYIRVRYQLISCLVTVLLAWGVTVSGGRWIAAAALVVLVVCGCVAMAMKHVCRSALGCFQLNLVRAGNEYILYTSVSQ